MSKSNSRYPILENLFNSRARVKILKFLFRNNPMTIEAKDLSRRIQESVEVVRKEIRELEKIGLIKKH